MYIANKFFNEYRPGDEIPDEDVNPLWVESGLVQEVESKEEFIRMVEENDAELLDALDPDKPVKRGRPKKE